MLQLLETSHAHLFVCCCHSGTRINRKVQWLLEGAKNVTSYSSSMLYESNLLPQRLSYEIFPSMHFCLLFHLINLFFLNVDYNILRQIDYIILNWTFFSILVLLYCCRLVLFVSTVILGFNKPWRSIQNSKKKGVEHAKLRHRNGNVSVIPPYVSTDFWSMKIWNLMMFLELI